MRVGERRAGELSWPDFLAACEAPGACGCGCGRRCLGVCQPAAGSCCTRLLCKNCWALCNSKGAVLQKGQLLVAGLVQAAGSAETKAGAAQVHRPIHPDAQPRQSGEQFCWTNPWD